MTAYTQSAATTLLSGATSIGPGTPSGYLEDPLGTVQAYSTFAVQVSSSGISGNYTVQLEGSLDGGTTWSTLNLASPNNNGFGADGLYLAAPVASQTVGSSSNLTANGGGAVLQIRAHLTYLGLPGSVTVVAIGIS